MSRYNEKRFMAVVPSAMTVLALSSLLATSSTTFAALGEIGFEFAISEKEMVLSDPDDVDMMNFAMWDTAYQRIQNRNMPWIEVTNIPTSTGNLTEFSLTIGDMDYNFTDATFGAGTYAFLSKETPNVDISSSSPTGDELFVTIGNGGLAPGESVIFGIDLDPDAGVPGLFPHPDFRLVLFDMNNMDGNGEADNSIASASFVDPLDATMVATLSTQLEDYEVTGPESQFFNHIIRPYGVMEGIDIFGGGTTSNVIPEPSTYAMIGMGLLGAAVWSRSRRSRSKRPTVS